MSKKLLNEATVRKFMKLANLANLSPTFLKEMQDEKMYEGGDMYEGGLYEEEDAMEADAGPEMGDDEPMDEPMDEDDKESLARDILASVADALEGALGVEVSVEGADEDDMEDEELPADDEDEDLMSPDEDDMEDEEPPADDEEGEEGALQEAIFRLLDKSNIEIVDDQALTETLVKRVAARVARRLLKESL